MAIFLVCSDRNLEMEKVVCHLLYNISGTFSTPPCRIQVPQQHDDKSSLNVEAMTEQCSSCCQYVEKPGRLAKGVAFFVFYSICA